MFTDRRCLLFQNFDHLESTNTGFITHNTELKDLRKIICLRKSEVSVGRKSVYKVIEKLAEHGRQYLPCSHTSDVINLLP